MCVGVGGGECVYMYVVMLMLNGGMFLIFNSLMYGVFEYLNGVYAGRFASNESSDGFELASVAN